MSERVEQSILLEATQEVIEVRFVPLNAVVPRHAPPLSGGRHGLHICRSQLDGMSGEMPIGGLHEATSIAVLYQFLNLDKIRLSCTASIAADRDQTIRMRRL